MQTFAEPISGYWDGGLKRSFEWTVERSGGRDRRGEYSRIGSWAANYWFHVSTGKTEKQTLANARRRLSSLARRAGKDCTFVYAD